MILQDAFTVEPWNLRETTWTWTCWLRPSRCSRWPTGTWAGGPTWTRASRTPCRAATSTGSTRHDRCPTPRSAYGLPETGQEIINITNGKLIRLFVDDEPFDVRSGELRSHERLLDFRAGTLTRRAEWVSPAGRPVRVSSVRLVSFTQRAVAAICYEVEPLDSQARIAVQSELVTNEQLPSADADPRATAALEDPLNGEYYDATGTAVILVHRTKRSGLRVGAAMEHLIDCPAAVRAESRSFTDGGLVTAAALLAPGQKLRVVKFVAYAWSGARSLTGVRDQVWAALAAARQAGWDGLLADQHWYLDDFWNRADVEVDGDPEVQQAVRFALFHVLQASARVENRAIPAKGLSGPGYSGHAFWDTETFVLPMLTLPPRTPPPARCGGGTARSRWPSTGPPSWAWPARPSRGGPSPAPNARATGPRARPRSTSTPTSRSPRSATPMPPVTKSSPAVRGWTC